MKQTILLADDSPTIQRLIERTFEGGEFTVVSVSNGDAAIRKLEELRPEAVLADIYMPGQNGYEVCAFVKQHPALSATPVVLLVGAFEAYDRREAERVGADGSITKPFEPKQVAEMVAGLVARRASHEGEPGPRARAAEAGRPAPEGRSQDAKPPAEPDVRIAASPLAGAVESGSLAASPAPAAEHDEAGEDETPQVGADADILGLRVLFPPVSVNPEHRALSEAEVDAIADRVIARLSAEVVESIAWDIVPEIADRVMRDELDRKK